jgi:hypothetical protein
MNAAPDSNHPLLLGKRLDTTELPRDLRIRTVDDDERARGGKVARAPHRTPIRNGDIDGNESTEPDSAWSPLNVTPMHPEYPSQAAIQAGAVSVTSVSFL